MSDDVRPVLLTDEVRELLALIKNTDISEVLIEHGDAKLHIKRAFAAPASATSAGVTQAPQVVVPLVATIPPAVAGDVEAPPQPTGVTVSAPMVGTFFAAPSPKDPPYVQVGDEVKPGDALGIIEAMKIMNEIECEVHGRVASIMAQNGQPVEYGQPLMVIEPI